MRDDIRRFLRERFGAEAEALSGAEVVIQGKEAWICSAEAARAPGPIKRRGIKLALRTPRTWKLTPQGAMIVGPLATRNSVELEDEDALAYMAGESLRGDFGARGQVIVLWRGFPVGTGLIKGNLLKNQLPGSRRFPPRARKTPSHHD